MKAMAFAIAIGVSSSRNTAAAFATRGLNRFGVGAAAAATATRSTTCVQASFLDDLTTGFQRTFSSMTGPESKYYTVGITGSSGLLGSALIDELQQQATVNGKPVRIVKMTRQDSAESKELVDAPVLSLGWSPKATDAESAIDPDVLAEMDAVVHLAGENVATGLGPLGFLGIRPWTDAKKAEILDSRVGPTEVLSKAVAACKTPTTFLVASGVGVYGSDAIGPNAQLADETTDVSSTGGFLADISRKWEAAAAAAMSSGNRVVNCRMGVVLSKNGGALGKLYPIFFLGGGGNVGSGEQYFTFISARDAARALVHTLTTPSLKGPVNVCSPSPCTNAEFTSAFGKVLSRPTILPLPSFAVSALFGEMGEEMLLGGVRAAPGKLEKSGFNFQHVSIDEALQSAVDETI